MSNDVVKFISLGLLRGDSDPVLWRGVISLQKRLDAGEISQAQVDGIDAILPNYFVAVSEGAAKRCIDGSSSSQPRTALGPQIQGGSADEAYACHLSGKLNGATLLDDLDGLQDVRSSIFAVGDHTDDHADETKTGCGAIDGQWRKLALYGEPDSATVIESTVATLMGLVGISPAPEAFKQLQMAAAQLAERSDYFPAPNEVLSKLRQLNLEGVEPLVRPHAEVSLTINFVPDTTFDRDTYNRLTNSTIQNFNLDAWNIISEYGQDGYVLLADAVATAMDLTDGSLRLFARLPA